MGYFLDAFVTRRIILIMYTLQLALIRFVGFVLYDWTFIKLDGVVSKITLYVNDKSIFTSVSYNLAYNDDDQCSSTFSQQICDGNFLSSSQCKLFSLH